jgi:hypothetical protein
MSSSEPIIDFELYSMIRFGKAILSWASSQVSSFDRRVHFVLWVFVYVAEQLREQKTFGETLFGLAHLESGIGFVLCPQLAHLHTIRLSRSLLKHNLLQNNLVEPLLLALDWTLRVQCFPQ